jgi:hypothetical protein
MVRIAGTRACEGGEMEAQREKRDVHFNGARAVSENERRKEERRQQPCEGYWYIQMVGWMDRRESVRRKDNHYD